MYNVILTLIACHQSVASNARHPLRRHFVGMALWRDIHDLVFVLHYDYDLPSHIPRIRFQSGGIEGANSTVFPGVFKK
jgi:hypothetical protein